MLFLSTRTSCLITILLTVLLIHAKCQANVITFSKTLYIPGQYFSLMNYTYQLEEFQDYFDIDMDFQLTQAAYGDQGNSIYDFFMFDANKYAELYPCYYEVINYLATLYKQYEPCQGGCVFQADARYGQNKTSFKMINDISNNVSLIVDNTFYPCKGGAFQSEIYLYQTITLSIQSNFDYELILKVIFVVMLQILIFLFAYIMIMINKLNNKKNKLKRIKEMNQDQDVLIFEKGQEK